MVGGEEGGGEEGGKGGGEVRGEEEREGWEDEEEEEGERCPRVCSPFRRVGRGNCGSVCHWLHDTRAAQQVRRCAIAVVSAFALR